MGVPLTVSSVPAQTPYVQYVATSLQTVFPYPFEITADADLIVALNAVTQGTDSGYTLSGQGTTGGGNVTFTVGLTAGTVVTLYRNIPISRITQLTQNGTFFSSNFNNEYNRIYLIMQQLQQSLQPGGVNAFALMVPNTNSPAPTTLLTPATYANKYLSFDSNGNPQPALLTSSGTITTPILAPFLNLGVTAAETAASVVPVSLQYAPGNVLRYGTNTTPGTTDMSAAFQASFNQQAQGGASVYAPTGTYKIASVISITSSAPFTMYGDGMGKTVISKSVDADCFQVTGLGSAFNQINISNMTIAAGVAMTSGSALNLSAIGTIPSVTMNNVHILCGGAFTFANAIKLRNCGESELNRVFISGIDSTSMSGVAITATQSETVYKFIGCSIYNCSTGVGITDTTNPGIEGVQFTSCDIVNVQFGVIYTNSFGVGYSPPQFTWLGGHINASNVGISLSIMSQVLITGLLSYNSGSNEHFNFNIVGDMTITGNIFVQTSGVADGIVVQSANGPTNGGVIANNEFKMGVTGNGVTLVATNYINFLITDLVRSGGSNTVSVSGSQAASVLVYVNQAQVTGWGTPVGGVAVNNYNITDAGGANSNTNKAVAQIITYLKARGDFGA